MFASVFRRLSAFVAFYLALHLTAVIAVPLEQRDLEARATPAAPHFVVYADQGQSGVTGPPAVSDVNVCRVSHICYFVLSRS